MRRLRIAPAWALGLVLAGCGADLTAPPPVEPTETRAARRPATAPPAAVTTGEADISWDTERDRRFAEFLRRTASSMIAQAAVGIDRKGLLNIEMTEAVAPEDTLDLTKSLVAGARKDFPDSPFVLTLFDPSGDPILRARSRPDRGVEYQIVEDGEGGPAADAGRADARDDAPTTRGRSDRDRRFAQWAEKTASRYLRYVEADLDRRGQLWIGITREVEPGDVRDLTRSLLEGARSEFPGRELTAIVFDPDGSRIGKAVLDRDGRVRWSE